MLYKGLGQDRDGHISQTSMKPVYYYYIGVSIYIIGSTQLTRLSEIKNYKLQSGNDWTFNPIIARQGSVNTSLRRKPRPLRAISVFYPHAVNHLKKRYIPPTRRLTTSDYPNITSFIFLRNFGMQLSKLPIIHGKMRSYSNLLPILQRENIPYLSWWWIMID